MRFVSKYRVLRSGPVRFFGQKRKDRDRDRFSSSEIYLKTGPDRVGPVCCSFLRSINWFGTGFYQDQLRLVCDQSKPVIWPSRTIKINIFISITLFNYKKNVSEAADSGPGSGGGGGWRTCTPSSRMRGGGGRRVHRGADGRWWRWGVQMDSRLAFAGAGGWRTRGCTTPPSRAWKGGRVGGGGGVGGWHWVVGGTGVVGGGTGR